VSERECISRPETVLPESGAAVPRGGSLWQPPHILGKGGDAGERGRGGKWKWSHVWTGTSRSAAFGTLGNTHVPRCVCWTYICGALGI